MVQKRKICFITGTRADYGLLLPVMNLVRKSDKLDLCLIVTGMHLLKEYGDTLKEVEKDNFPIYKIKIDFDQKDPSQMGKSVGKAVIKFSQILAKTKPDLVVVLGDRGEMLAMAIMADYLNIPVAHIHGGEISGHVDGIVRHAITKLSHLHFAATKKAQKRIIQMGEEPWRVINSGAPGIDAILNDKVSDKKELYRKYKINNNKPLIILIQHPVSTDIDSGKEIQKTIQAISDFEARVIIVYPNSDAGSVGIITEIEKHRNQDNISIYKSLPRNDYLGLLKIADVLVGNSSSGIIEAASFKLPVIDIGPRQENRERGLNVFHVEYDKEEISKILKKILSRDKLLISKMKKVKNPYGQGKASQKIVDILEKIDLDKLQSKKMTY